MNMEAFDMKNCEKCDVTCSWTPFLCHKLSHLLGPPPLERDVLYGRPLYIIHTLRIISYKEVSGRRQPPFNVLQTFSV